MGVNSLQELVDDGQPVSPEEIAAHRHALREEATEERLTRAGVEESFATEREKIEAKFNEAVAKASERRDNALAKNLDKRTKSLEKVGLNPSGTSDPRRDHPTR